MISSLITNLSFNLVILLSLFSQFECQSSGSRCSQRENNNMDLIVSKIITIGKTGRKFPETMEQGAAYCRYESPEHYLINKLSFSDTKKYLEQAQSFIAKCMEKFSKQTASVFLFTLKSQLRQICSKNTKRLQELIKFSPCANQQVDEIEKCYFGFIDALIGTKDIADEKQKIPSACW